MHRISTIPITSTKNIIYFSNMSSKKLWQFCVKVFLVWIEKKCGKNIYIFKYRVHNYFYETVKGTMHRISTIPITSTTKKNQVWAQKSCDNFLWRFFLCELKKCGQKYRFFKYRVHNYSYRRVKALCTVSR